MQHRTGHLALTGALWESDLPSFADILHRLSLRPYHPDNRSAYPDFSVKDMADALISGFGFFWFHKSTADVRKLRTHLQQTPLSWCIYRPTSYPVKSVIWDAPRQAKVFLPMVNGEIALTASQAICPQTRTTILAWRSHLVSRGFTVVGSRHQLLRAAQIGALPADHIPLTLAQAKIDA